MPKFAVTDMVVIWKKTGNENKNFPSEREKKRKTCSFKHEREPSMEESGRMRTA